MNLFNFSFVFSFFYFLILWTSLYQLIVDGALGNCWATRLKNIKSKKSKIRGVNLDGLHSIDPEFVALLYQNDTIADATDEYLETNYQIDTSETGIGVNDTLPKLTLLQWTNVARAVGLDTRTLLIKQWWSYFNELNFALMARADINSIRINIGWWTVFNGADPAASYGYQGGDLAYLDSAFVWANKYGISVLVNLHDLAGQSETDDSTKMWNSTNTALSLQALTALVTRYFGKPALLGFQVANEPVSSPSVQTYYVKAYNIIRPKCPLCVIVISDPGNLLIAPFMIPPKYTNVWTETHYLITNTGGMNTDQILNAATAFSTKINTYALANNLAVKGRPLLIGEWSGVGIVGLTQGSKIYANMKKQFILQQRQAFSASKNAGWYFSTWTQSATINATESPSYLSALQDGTISITDNSPDTNACPFSYTCQPVYTLANPAPFTGRYLNGVGQCGQCGLAAQLTAKKVNRAVPSTWYQSVGCYNDVQQRPDFLIRQSVAGLTLEKCNTLCNSFQFFGVQSNGICSCGDFYGAYGANNTCSSPCPGNTNQICGGDSTNSVYRRNSPEVLCAVIA